MPCPSTQTFRWRTCNIRFAYLNFKKSCIFNGYVGQDQVDPFTSNLIYISISYFIPCLFNFILIYIFLILAFLNLYLKAIALTHHFIFLQFITSVLFHCRLFLIFLVFFFLCLFIFRISFIACMQTFTTRFLFLYGFAPNSMNTNNFISLLILYFKLHHWPFPLSQHFEHFDICL